MSESPKIKKDVTDSYRHEINRSGSNQEIKKRFLKRIEKGRLSLGENPKNHFTVSFIAYDPKKKLVYAGLHKKSNLWMFNGGHVEKNESIADALKREMKEEWGNDSFLKTRPKPLFLTITPVISPGDKECKLHYSIWYFIPIDSNEFSLPSEILEEEYVEAGWKTFVEANKLIIVPNYLIVLREAQKKSQDTPN